MANKNVISSKKIVDISKKILKDTLTQNIEWNEMSVVVKRIIPLDMMIRFVDNVVESCFQGDSREYMPEYMDFAIRSNVIAMYTNVELPKDYADQYAILYGTNLVDAVLEIVDRAQFQDMLRSADHKLENMLENKTQLLNLKIDSVATKMNELSDTIGELFSGVTQDDIKKIVPALSSVKIDEKKLMEAYAEVTSKGESNGSD